MKALSLHFKWTTSRGQNTYGYNICTLLVNGDKKGKCMGGGYDMKGTSLAQWLSSEFQAQLQEAFFAAMIELKATKSENDYDRVEVKGFYGATAIRDNKTGNSWISLDGGCGFSSMEQIAAAIGIKLQWNKESDRYRNSDFYTALIGANEKKMN